MNAKEYLLGALRAGGLTHVSMVPGGMIDGFYPSPRFRPPVTPFEQAKKEWHDDV